MQAAILKSTVTGTEELAAFFKLVVGKPRGFKFILLILNAAILVVLLALLLTLPEAEYFSVSGIVRFFLFLEKLIIFLLDELVDFL